MAAVPAALVPIRLPLMTLPVAMNGAAWLALIMTPSWLPEIRLPDTVLVDDSPMKMPSEPLPSAAVPAALVPM